MKRGSRPVLRAFLVLAVVLAIGAGIWRLAAPRPVPVTLTPVSRGPLRVVLEEEGRTRMRHRYVVTAPVRGRLQRIALEVGDAVEPGSTVARIDPLIHESALAEAKASIAEWRAQIEGVDTLRPKEEALRQARLSVEVARGTVEEARANVRRAEAALDEARTEARRVEKLAAQRIATESQLEQARTAEALRTRELDAVRQRQHVAELQVLVAEAAAGALESQERDPDYLLDVYQARIQGVAAKMRTLEDELARTVVASPARGVVLRLFEQSERVVEAGTPLLEIGDPGALEVLIDVLSVDAVRIETGAPIDLEWGGSERLTARVRLVEPSAFTKLSALGVEEQRVNVVGDLPDPPPSLGDAYRVEAKIVLWESADVLKVPVSALFRSGRDWAVFVARSGRAELVPVQIGHIGASEAEVLSGLVEGDQVVLHPGSNLTSGTTIVGSN